MTERGQRVVVDESSPKVRLAITSSTDWDNLHKQSTNSTSFSRCLGIIGRRTADNQSTRPSLRVTLRPTNQEEEKEPNFSQRNRTWARVPPGSLWEQYSMMTSKRQKNPASVAAASSSSSSSTHIEGTEVNYPNSDLSSSTQQRTGLFPRFT